MRRPRFTDALPRLAGSERPQRLADEAYGAILGQLMSLRIPPGGPINIDDLAREIGISQTPIREALGRLEAYGLVVKRQFVGYAAAPPLTRRQFMDLCEMRLRLEPYLAARAAETIDTVAAETLCAYVESMVRPRPGDPVAVYGRFAREDAALHDCIAVAAGNTLVRETLARLHTHLHLFRMPRHTRITDDAIAEHREIVRALAAHDAEAASDAMRRHIEKVYDRFGALFDGA